jgi:hypothetical protein
MSLFNTAEPLLRAKQDALDLQDRVGLWQFQWQIGQITLSSGFLTRVDQAFLIWGVISLLIFVAAQFLVCSWHLQAVIWTFLTLLGTVGMVILTRFWTQVEHLCWMLYLWAGLMLTGLALTDLGIFQGWGEILVRLCPLWLGLCAVGYLCTGWGLRSRTLLFTGLIHLLSIALLPYVNAWQFLTTGLIVGGSLMLLATCQWDMRPPIESAVLTDEQKQFNREQYRQRQLAT